MGLAMSEDRRKNTSGISKETLKQQAKKDARLKEALKRNISRRKSASTEKYTSESDNDA